MKKLGMGVVGVGAMGKRHAENLRRLIPQAQLVAIADASRERARQVAAELEIEHYYDTAEALVERKDIQGVVIATPAKFHGAAIQLCAQGCKDIFCEKPLTLTLQEADAALEAVDKVGIRLQVGHVRRFDPPNVDAKRRIEAGEIGNPVIFKSLARDPAPPPLSYLQAGVNGMFYQDSSVHEFDLARWLMNDEIAEVHAYGGVLVCPELAQFNDIDSTLVNMRFARGAIGNVENYMQACYGYDVRTEIVGSKGTILTGYLAQKAEVVLTASGSRRDVVSHFLVRFAEGYLQEMRDFVETILADRAPQVTGEDGRRALVVALAAERSYRESRPVAISEITARL